MKKIEAFRTHEVKKSAKPTDPKKSSAQSFRRKQTVSFYMELLEISNFHVYKVLFFNVISIFFQTFICLLYVFLKLFVKGKIFMLLTFKLQDPKKNYIFSEKASSSKRWEREAFWALEADETSGLLLDHFLQRENSRSVADGYLINSSNFRFLLFYDLLLYGIGLISKRKESQTEQRLEGLKCHENPKSIDDKDH